uniref:Alternative protein KIAA1109 n=1 Tax=Homo sapiens TaxID=9606 RepID=L8ECG0_HUMAN|nr:alternative protein KIAA1109 [Homo sapiens]
MQNLVEHQILIGMFMPQRCSLSHLDLSDQMLEQKKAKKLQLS